MKKVIFISALLLLILLIFNTQLVLADHVGDYYDNRDGDHARMDVTPHTGLTYMSSGYGAQSSVIPDKVVFGNASLAVVSGIYWGSMVRYYHMRSQSGMDNAYDLYVIGLPHPNDTSTRGHVIVQSYNHLTDLVLLDKLLSMIVLLFQQEKSMLEYLNKCDFSAYG